MRTEKLFGLLVVGGAALAAGSAPVKAQVIEEAAPAFCSPHDPTLPEEENTCVLNADGTQSVREGLECCWGTSCDADVEG
jgi:hypothetical protein